MCEENIYFITFSHVLLNRRCRRRLMDVFLILLLLLSFVAFISTAYSYLTRERHGLNVDEEEGQSITGGGNKT